jgi:hypothetical protein
MDRNSNTAVEHLEGVSASDQTPPTTRLTTVVEFRRGLRWAQSVLRDPRAASVQASGLSTADLDAIEQAAGGTS